MSEVRSWSAPAQQLSGRPTVAVTDELNSLIFIKSKTPLYLVMTDQSASSTASMPSLPSSLLSRFWREQHTQKFISIILIHTCAFSHLRLKLVLLTTVWRGEIFFSAHCSKAQYFKKREKFLVVYQVWHWVVSVLTRATPACLSTPNVSTTVTYVITLSKACIASSNILKEIVKLSKEKYK